MSVVIPVTRPYLPNIQKYKGYIEEVYSSGWLTNGGPLVNLLEERLREFLGVRHVILLANGSLALQVAYKALEIEGEVVTTPFTFVATASTLVWEGLVPVFGDIEACSLNLDPQKIRARITGKTSAILPVHVFGNPCRVEEISAIARDYGLKVLYDGAHAFGVRYRGKSILSHGDVTTVSFHATKVFHTGEGGAIITESDDVARKVRLLINFGIVGPERIEGVGTNAKMNELEAAMGLCVLDDIDLILADRHRVHQRYCEQLSGRFQMQQTTPEAAVNSSYVPILFEDERSLLAAMSALAAHGVAPRRYFFPSLDTLNYLAGGEPCPISRSVASRILCLPTYYGLGLDEIDRVCDVLLSFG